MSFIDTLKNKAEELKDFTKHIKCTEEEKQARLSICNACEHMLFTGNCTKCGCFMRTKSWMVHKKCPIGKW